MGFQKRHIVSLLLIALQCVSIVNCQRQLMIAGYGFQNPINNLAISNPTWKHARDDRGVFMSLPKGILQKHGNAGAGALNGNGNALNREFYRAEAAKLKTAELLTGENFQKFTDNRFPRKMVTSFLNAAAVLLVEGYLIPKCETLLMSNTGGTSIYGRFLAADLCNRLGTGVIRKAYALGGYAVRELVE